MSRLIDADVLIKRLKRNSIFNAITDSAGMNVFEIIDEQPTAFDVENVVEDLEDEQRKDIEDAKFYRDTKNEKLCIAYTSKARAYKDAIDIVKRGGVE